MKNVKRNSIILIIFTIIVLIFILKDNFYETMQTLYSAKIPWIIVAIFLVVIAYLVDSASYYYMIRAYKKDYKYSYACRLNIITKFFNGITPLSTGGQPMQIYELKKRNISGAEGTNIIFQNFIIYQISVSLVSTIAVILNQIYHFFPYVPVLREITLVGYLFGIIILIFALIISFSEKFNTKIVSFFINLLSKIKIVKNKEKQIKKWQDKCERFYKSTLLLKQNKKVILKGLSLQILEKIINYSVPLFVALSLGVAGNLNLLNTVVCSAYISLIGGLVPIPGGTGGMEYGFMSFFGTYIPIQSISATILIWRFITYYIPVIIGGIVFNTKIKTPSKPLNT